MPTLQDGLLIRTYTDSVEIIEGFFNAPSSTTISLSYTPPIGKAIILIHKAVGNLNPFGRIMAYLDGTLFYETGTISNPVTGLWAVDKIIDSYIGWYAKDTIQITYVNSDTVKHTVDFALIGILVPKDKLQNFIDHGSGIENLRNQREIIEQNAEIIRLLRERG